MTGENRTEDKYIYVVKQWQESEGYEGVTFISFTTEKEAMKCCDYYNSEYGDGNTHYYEIDAIRLCNEWTKE